jgi:hypothetical protein
MPIPFRPAHRNRLARKAIASLAVFLAWSCINFESTEPEAWTPLTPVARIEVAPTSVTLRIGTATTLHAQAYDSSGRGIATSFSWNTSDPSVATVNRNDANVGTVTAVSAGEATITVSSPSLSVSVKVTVPPDPVAVLQILPEELLLPVSMTFQLTVSAKDAAGRPTPATAEWSSDDPAVATVDRVTGLVTAVSVGNANVAASVGSVTASIPVRVEPADFIAQWAISASASSEYSNTDWSAAQATGVPDVITCADESRAWASVEPNTVDWLELTYQEPVRPSEILIHEVYAIGSIVKVEVRDLGGTYHVVYEASPTSQVGCLRKLPIKVEGVTSLVNMVRVTIDQRVRNDWNEIDAVRLSGYRSR